jgi:hypothetical protein
MISFINTLLENFLLVMSQGYRPKLPDDLPTPVGYVGDNKYEI